ncbi:MAG: antitoxin VbhA family protein, partial [Elusimicrobiota bacterium]|nr:antitoxin VbhA family protein [Elusimicrobiota bacterium]
MNKQKAWDYALGLIKIDGLKPTPDFMDMVEKEIRGEMTLEDIEKRLNAKY